MAKLGTIVPLVILIIVLGIAGAVGYVAYSIVMDVADKTSKKMEKKNMSIGRDGLKVGVKEVTAEEVGDSTQSVLMKIWSNSSFPAYKSRLGWNQSQPSPVGTPTTEKRKPFSRTTSTQDSKKP